MLAVGRALLLGRVVGVGLGVESVDGTTETLEGVDDLAYGQYQMMAGERRSNSRLEP